MDLDVARLPGALGMRAGKLQRWRDALRVELGAVQAIERGLRAFSGRQNFVAARSVERALKDFSNTLTVKCLDVTR